MSQGKWYTMGSGAKLLVSVSEYGKVIELHDALLRELQGRGVGTLDVVELQRTIRGQSVDGLNVLVDRLMGVAASREFKAALFACAAKAVYCPTGALESGLRFDPDAHGYGVFDNPQHAAQARQDFYDIAKAVLEENLRPFGKALFSAFTALAEGRAEAPASSSAKASPPASSSPSA